MILALLRVVNSPFGRVLQGIRENRFRAEALGFRTVFHLAYGNCIVALVAASAGMLNALWLRYAGPDTSLSFSIMLDILLMVVIGGMGTIYGAIIGATIFILAQNYLQALMSAASNAAADAGLPLLPAFSPPPGVVLPFVNVRLIGNRAVIAGHGPQSPEGPLAQPLGKVGRELTLEQGYMAAKLTALSMLAYLKRELGDLDRISHWVRIFGMVNSAPGFVQRPAVINGFSDLILELFGPEAGAHARSAVGMAELPFGMPVQIEVHAHIPPSSLPPP